MTRFSVRFLGCLFHNISVDVREKFPRPATCVTNEVVQSKTILVNRPIPTVLGHRLGFSSSIQSDASVTGLLHISPVTYTLLLSVFLAERAKRAALL